MEKDLEKRYQDFKKEKRYELLNYNKKIHLQLLKDAENFKDPKKILPDENSSDFGELLSEIDSCCKAYSDDPEPFRNKFEIGDVEFRTSIEKIYFKM